MFLDKLPLSFNYFAQIPGKYRSLISMIVIQKLLTQNREDPENTYSMK